MAGEKLPVFNHGRMVRDFTYIDDVVEGVTRVLACPLAGAVPESDAPYRVLNLGNGRPVELLDYIRTLKACLGRKAQLQLLPMQPGDVTATLADVSGLEAAVGYRPVVSVDEGVRRFVEWYLAHYNVRPVQG